MIKAGFEHRVGQTRDSPLFFRIKMAIVRANSHPMDSCVNRKTTPTGFSEKAAQNSGNFALSSPFLLESERLSAKPTGLTPGRPGAS